MNPSEITLKHGSHRSPQEGVCLLEAVAWIAGLPHTDRPSCTDPVLGAFGRGVNDWMSDDERQLLVPLIPKLVGTAGDSALSLRRMFALVDGVVRQIVPLAFEAIGLTTEAKSLRDLQPIMDEKTANAAAYAAYAARVAANAAYAARVDAAYAAYAAASAAASAAAYAANAAAYAAAYAADAAADAAARAAAAAYAAAYAAYAARKSVVEAVVQIFTAAIELR